MALGRNLTLERLPDFAVCLRMFFCLRLGRGWSKLGFGFKFLVYDGYRELFFLSGLLLSSLCYGSFFGVGLREDSRMQAACYF